MAANRIKGITIEIGGDTTKLQKALQNVDKDLRATETNLKDVNKLLKFDPKNAELLAQKQKNLEKAIGLTKDRLKQLKDAQGKVKEGTSEWDALQREIVATEQDLKSLEKEYAKLFEDLLCENNPSAKPAFQNGSLGHCEVKFLRHGTYDDYRQMLKDRGANLNQVKPVKLIDNEERKNFFFSHIIEE